MWGLKSDFGGHHEVYSNNVLPYVGDCLSPLGDQHEYGFNDGFYNNSCIYRTSYTSDCFITRPSNWSGAGMEIHDNQVFSQTGQTLVCNFTIPLSDWVAKGHDHGSVSSIWPKDEQLVEWIKEMLGYYF